LKLLPLSYGLVWGLLLLIAPAGQTQTLLGFLGDDGRGLPDIFKDPLRAYPAKALGLPLRDDADNLLCPVTNKAPEPLTLSSALDLALCHHPQLRASLAGVALQSAAVGEARAAWLPTLNGGVNKLHSRTRYPDSGTVVHQNGITANASLSLRLLDFGGRAANQQAANDLLEAALMSHQASVQKLMGDVVRSYYDTLIAQATLAARNEVVSLAEQTTVISQRRQAHGAGSDWDVLQARSAMAKAKLAQQRAHGDAQQAEAILALALGFSADTRMILPASGEDFVLPATGQEELTAWIKDAEQAHPALLSARAQIAAAQERITVVRSEGLPVVDLTANVYRNGYPNQGLQATNSVITNYGVSVSIPIFEGFARTYKVRAAQAQLRQKQADWALAVQEVATELAKAYIEASAALANVSSAQELQKVVNEAYRSALRRYENGRIAMPELLDAQSSLADARQEYLRCWGQWHSARLRLITAAGKMDKTRALAP
jgi:outer membrane protein